MEPKRWEGGVVIVQTIRGPQRSVMITVLVLFLFISPVLQESDVQTKELRAKIDAAEHRRLENIQLQANHVSEVSMCGGDIRSIYLYLSDATFVIPGDMAESEFQYLIL